MNIIELSYLELKTFTEQDASDYCQLNSIISENITELDLFGNELTDITGIKLFKNLKELLLFDNDKLKNISAVQYLNNLEVLKSVNCNIKNISVLKNLIKLKRLDLGYNQITDISVIQYLKNIEILDIRELKLESDQIKYINSLKDLKQLYCQKGFKDMSVLNQLNKNIRIIK